MQENKQAFPLAAVLSILLDKILIPQISEIRTLCSFLTGAQIYSHQISRAVTECIDELKKQCPQFDHLNRNEISRENAEKWVKQKEKEFGSTVLLTPITKKYFNFDDPIGDMKIKNKIIIS